MSTGLPQWISLTQLAQCAPAIEATRVRPGDGISWYDADLSGSSDAEALAGLVNLCPGLSEELVKDVLAPDNKPDVKDYGLRGEVRKVSAFRVRLSEPSDSSIDEPDANAVALVFEQMEFAVGPGWLITCRHPLQQVPGSASPGADVEPISFEKIVIRVKARWPNVVREDKSPPTSSDLGLVILQELADSYTEARRALRRSLEGWESSLYNKLELAPTGLSSSRKPRRPETITAEDLLPLMRLRHLRSELFARIEPLNRSGMRRNPDLIWFPRGDPGLAEAVDQPLDRALLGLRDFGDALRASVELVATFIQAEQSHQSERFQELAAFIAAVLLVPTLVAAIYGANIYLPGKDRPTGLWIMIIVMVISALVTGVAIHLWRKRRKHTSRLLGEG